MYKRDIWEKIEKEIFSDEIIVITGPRQVGKTTTLKWILEQIPSENKLYIDLESLSNREIFSNKNYENIVYEFQNLGLNKSEQMYIALDEIQLVQNLPSVVKYLYDHYNIKFFLSGSSSYYLKNRFTESMAGRKIIFEIFPLNFFEFLRFKEVREPYRAEKKDFANLLPITQSKYEYLREYYDEFVNYGGVPNVVLEPDIARKKMILNEIFNSYITLDVETLADFKNITDFRTLIRLLASRIGSKLDVSKLSQILGISRPTIYTYLEFLEQTYVIKQLEVFSNSEDIKSKISKKTYFVDTGIASINADLSEGAKFENTLRHQLRFYGDLNYYTKKTLEIDFILNRQKAFEAKLTPVSKDKKKLERIASKLGISECFLVGKTFTANFDDFIYAGLI